MSFLETHLDTSCTTLDKAETFYWANQSRVSLSEKGIDL